MKTQVRTLISKSPALRLMRADKPVGVWLLLWPCWWGLAWAGAFPGTHLWLYAAFALGAFFMRSAGCIVNDLADREFDKQVARTLSRPLASGEMNVGQAVILLATLLILSATILITFNRFTIFLGLLSLILVVTYPFMKRITYWPQAFLGLTFNWGALMGFAAVTSTLSPSALLIYTAGFFWTLGYDTIYAHQDKEDDLKIGVKSSALKLGNATKPVLTLFYIAMTGLLALAGYLESADTFYYGGLGVLLIALLALTWPVNLNDSRSCLINFKRHTWAGFFLWTLFLLKNIININGL